MSITRSEPKSAKFALPGLPASEWADVIDDNGQPGAMGPLIFNAWYVIALSTDVGRTLGRITALGQPLVHYRTIDGRPVVLDDRCAHRRYSLSKGVLKGDTIQCGYHGFTYAETGQCIWAPGMPVSEERGAGLPFGVRTYPCVEKGPWLWVWMGDPDSAESSPIPLPEMQDRPASTICGYKLNPSNYMMIIENLLDLSHLHFLHKASDLASVAVIPQEVSGPPNSVIWEKTIEASEVLLAAKLCGGDPKRLAYERQETGQYGPSLCYGDVRRTALPGDDLPMVPELMQIAHAITPVDARNTHQFFTMSMSDPFVIDKDEVLHVIQDIVFEEDVDVLRSLQENADGDYRTGRTEFSMAYDKFGMKMRRILSDLKKAEI